MNLYVIDPYLLDGFKFDMRMYVLVTSFQPLEAFLYDEGFARLSTVLYTKDPEQVKNLVCNFYYNYKLLKYI